MIRSQTVILRISYHTAGKTTWNLIFQAGLCYYPSFLLVSILLQKTVFPSFLSPGSILCCIYTTSSWSTHPSYGHMDAFHISAIVSWIAKIKHVQITLIRWSHFLWVNFQERDARSHGRSTFRLLGIPMLFSIRAVPADTSPSRDAGSFSPTPSPAFIGFSTFRWQPF